MNTVIKLNDNNESSELFDTTYLKDRAHYPVNVYLQSTNNTSPVKVNELDFQTSGLTYQATLGEGDIKVGKATISKSTNQYSKFYFNTSYGVVPMPKIGEVTLSNFSLVNKPNDPTKLVATGDILHMPFLDEDPINLNLLDFPLDQLPELPELDFTPTKFEALIIRMMEYWKQQTGEQVCKPVEVTLDEHNVIQTLEWKDSYFRGFGGLHEIILSVFGTPYETVYPKRFYAGYGEYSHFWTYIFETREGVRKAALVNPNSYYGYDASQIAGNFVKVIEETDYNLSNFDRGENYPKPYDLLKVGSVYLLKQREKFCDPYDWNSSNEGQYVNGFSPVNHLFFNKEFLKLVKAFYEV